MGKIDDLIQQYCPDGVEYVKLGVATSMKRGTSTTKNAMEAGVIPVISGGKQPAFYCNQSNREGETITVAGSGAGAGYVQYWNEPIYVCDAFSVKGNDNVSTKYVYYFLSSIQEKIYSTKKGGGVPHVHISSIEDFEIPIPPLPMQEEIVRILDNFTNLAAELQAELQARQQQYNYYRDTLLSNFTPEQQVKEYTLGELGTFTRGNGLQKKDFTETGVGCIHYGQIYTRFGAFTDKTLTYVDETLASRLLKVEKGNLVIACTSENVEDICKCVAWLGEDDICTGGHACVFRHKQNPKYIAYFFQTDYFFNQKVKYTYGTKVKDIKPDSIAKIKIPLPSLKEQERIVSILDNLYTLSNDLTIGLPAEIGARQQQYEYYRDQLLTFKRKEA